MPIDLRKYANNATPAEEQKPQQTQKPGSVINLRDFVTTAQPQPTTGQTARTQKGTSNASRLSELQRQRDALFNSVDRRRAETDRHYANSTYARISDLDSQIEALQKENYATKKVAEYGDLPSRADYKQKSTTVDETLKNAFGVQIGNKFFGKGDPTYSYINGLTAQDNKGNLNAPAAMRKYDYMTDEEKANYNYLYQAEGEKSANKYLEYLSYALNDRQQTQISEANTKFAEEHPVAASVYSVASNLGGGAGLLGVAAQNIQRDRAVKRGEEWKPIDYSRPSMTAANTTTDIRGTVAENIADKTGTIQLDEKEHPILSRILNGKGWGDVYQLGMSMADSYLGGLAFGPAVTIALGGAAGTQGMLEALDRGATDKQALGMGLLSGTSEALFEYVSLDKLFTGDYGNILQALAVQGFVEGSEEVSTSLVNTIADIGIMMGKSEWQTKVSYYMDHGMTEKDALRQTFLDTAISIGWDFIGGAITGGIMGGTEYAISDSRIAQRARTMWEPFSVLHDYKLNENGYYDRRGGWHDMTDSTVPESERVYEAEDADGNKAYARTDESGETTYEWVGKDGQKHQLKRKAKGTDTNGTDTNGTNTQTETAAEAEVEGMTAKEYAKTLEQAMQPAQQQTSYAQTEQQPTGESDWLTEFRKGLDEEFAPFENGDVINAGAVEEAIQNGTFPYDAIKDIPIDEDIRRDKTTTNELIERGKREYAEKLAAQEAPQDGTSFVGDSGIRYTKAQSDALSKISNDALITFAEGGIADQSRPYNRFGISEDLADELRKAGLLQTESSEDGDTYETVKPDAMWDERGRRSKEESRAIAERQKAIDESASARSKNPDVQRAIAAAESYGESGVPFSLLVDDDMGTKLDSVKILTPAERSAAYLRGKKRSESKAQKQQSQRDAEANGKTGRRSGSVIGDGVKISDLKETFNDPQGIAYSLLSTISEVTGIDIILYRSESADGVFTTPYEGKFKKSTDQIYLDLNSGLIRTMDVDQLAKYVILRTFGHEITHFDEKWSPVLYNEFRQAVFDYMDQNGTDVDELIREQQEDGRSYEAASREVVADAMTDVLPDSNFVEMLAKEHRNVFQRILDKLKEFVAKLKEAFANMAPNNKAAANALKKNMDGALHYAQNIVDLFDRMTVDAVERYQRARAVDDGTTVATTEETAEAETSSAEETRTPVSNAQSVEERDNNDTAVTSANALFDRLITGDINDGTVYARSNDGTLYRFTMYRVDNGGDPYYRYAVYDVAEDGSEQRFYESDKYDHGRDAAKDASNRFEEYNSAQVSEAVPESPTTAFTDGSIINESVLDQIVEDAVNGKPNPALDIIMQMTPESQQTGKAAPKMQTVNPVDLINSLNTAQVTANETGEKQTVRLSDPAQPVEEAQNNHDISTPDGVIEALRSSGIVFANGYTHYIDFTPGAKVYTYRIKRDDGKIMHTSPNYVSRDQALEAARIFLNRETSKKYFPAEKPVKSDTSGYTITDGTQPGYVQVQFSEKHSADVLAALKQRKFKWSSKNKLWYGKGTRADLEEILGGSTDTPAVETAATAETTPPVAEETAPTEAAAPAEEAAPAALTPSKVYKNGTVTVNVFNSQAEYDAYTEDVESDDPIFQYNNLTIINNVETGKYAADGFFPHKSYKMAVKKFLKQLVGYPGFEDWTDPEGILEAISNGTWKMAEPGEFSWGVETNSDDENGNPVWYIYLNVNHTVTTGAVETPNNNNVEAKTNGEETEGSGSGESSVRSDNVGAVPVPESDGEGAARLVDEREAGDVQSDGERRNPDGSAGEAGGSVRQSGDNVHEAGASGVRGEGTGESGLSDLNPAALEERDRQQKSTEQPGGSNFIIGESLNLPSGEKGKYKANVKALRLAHQIQTENRFATAEEQEALSKYVGWGGLSKAFGRLINVSDRNNRKGYSPDAGWEKELDELWSLVDDGIITASELKSMANSSTNAHYTSIEVVKAMWEGLQTLGFKGGRLMEPSCGTGNFVGGMPAEMLPGVKSWTMVELDRVTGGIAKLLYPHADVKIQGFQDAKIPDNMLDVVIGNVPFGKSDFVDKRYPKNITDSLHDYFFIKSLDKVRPGGIVMMLTSMYTMDKKDSKVRDYIAARADLIGAVRLPNTAFIENAATSVVTDMLILKKRAPGTPYSGESFVNLSNNRSQVAGAASYDYAYDYFLNEYFVNHPEMVLGTPDHGTMYGGRDEITYNPIKDGRTLRQQITDAIATIQTRMEYPESVSVEKINVRTEAAEKNGGTGSYQVKDGQLVKVDGGAVELSSEDQAKMVGIVSIRNAYQTLVAALNNGYSPDVVSKARKELNTAYDGFVAKYGYINSQKNSKLIEDDPARYQLLALEIDYDKGSAKSKIPASARKADIFTKDTISPNVTVKSVDTVEEGIIASINISGGIDPEYIGKLMGKTGEQISELLDGSNDVFRDDSGNFQYREKYLSGNVRAKLEKARYLAENDSRYEKNVRALEAVMPEDIPAGRVQSSVNIGARWIDTEYYTDFLKTKESFTVLLRLTPRAITTFRDT